MNETVGIHKLMSVYEMSWPYVVICRYVQYEVDYMLSTLFLVTQMSL